MNVVWVEPICVVIQRSYAFLNIWSIGVLNLIPARVAVLVILSLVALSVFFVIVSTLTLVVVVTTTSILVSLIILIILLEPFVLIVAFLHLMVEMAIGLPVIFLRVLHVG